MAERMEINVDFLTADALNHVRGLVSAMDGILGAARGATSGLTDTEGATAGVAKAADAAGPKFEAMGAKITEAGQKGSAGMKDVGSATDAVGTSTGKLLGSVTSLVQGYLGLQGVLAILSQVNQKTQEALDAQSRLVGATRTYEESLRLVADNLKIALDPEGTKRVGEIVAKFAADIGSSKEQAAQLVASLSATGMFGAGPAGGAGRVFGQTAVRFGFDAETIEQLTKVAVGARIPQAADPQRAMTEFLTRVQAASGVSAIPAMSDFARGMFEPMAMARRLGIDENQALAEYTQATNLFRNSRRAGQELSQYYRMVAGELGGTKTESFLATQAVRGGFITPAPIDEKAIAAEIQAGVTPEAKAVRETAQRVVTMAPATERARRERADRLTDLETQLARAKQRELIAKEPDIARADTQKVEREITEAKADEAEARRVEDENTRDAVSNAKAAEAKLRQRRTSEAAVAAYRRSKFTDRQKAFAALVEASKGDTPEAQAVREEILTGVGGVPQAMEAAQQLGEAPSRAAVAQIRQGIARTRPAGFLADIEGYRGTNAFRDAQARARREIRDFQAAGAPGVRFAEQIREDATSAVGRMQMRGVGIGAIATVTGFFRGTATTQGQQAIFALHEGYKRLKDFERTLTDEEKSYWGPAFQTLLSEGDPANMPAQILETPTQQENKIRMILIAFGALMESVETERRAVSQGGSIGAPSGPPRAMQFFTGNWTKGGGPPRQTVDVPQPRATPRATGTGAPAAPAATQPAGPRSAADFNDVLNGLPAAGGPLPGGLAAAGTTIYNQISVGNYFSRPGEDISMPARLDGTLG
jgi:hypothetical protein